jgi:hypothetical protein
MPRPQSPTPPKPAPEAQAATSAAGASFDLRALIVIGVDGTGVAIDELMALELGLASRDGVLDIGAAEAGGESLRLADLARRRATAVPITRAALDSVANQIADVYAAKGLARPDVFVLPPPILPNRRTKPDGRIVMVVKSPAPAATRAEN